MKKPTTISPRFFPSVLFFSSCLDDSYEEIGGKKHSSLATRHGKMKHFIKLIRKKITKCGNCLENDFEELNKKN
jgi:hypothetical protein